MLAPLAVRGGVGAGVEHQIELTAESLWSEVSGRLRGALNDTTYGTWFGEVAGLELSDEGFILAVPNDFTRDWIEGHFLDLIGAAIRDVTGGDRPVVLRIVETAPAGAAAEGGAPVIPVVARIQTRAESGGCNAHYHFDSFVIGSPHPS